MPRVDQRALDDLLGTISAKVKDDAVRAKLRNLHATCRALVVDGGVMPTVHAVAEKYKVLFGPHMAAQSIRNKRDGKNPYNELYEAWNLQAKADVARKWLPGDIVASDELASIRDHDLRHRVALTMADNRHLRSKVSILEAAGKERTIVVEGLDPMGAAKIPARAGTPDRRDIEEIRDFLDQLRERGLVKRADRAMATDDGRLLADPGFLDALERIVAAAK